MKHYILQPDTDVYYNLTKGKMYFVEKIDNEALYFTDDNGNLTFIAIDEINKSFDLFTLT